MNREEIRRELTSIFSNVLDEEINLIDTLTAHDVPEWDSMNHVRIIVSVEKKFKLKFSTREILSLKNVGDFISLIETKQ